MPDQSESAVLRRLIYELRHLGAIRLERHRLGHTDGVPASYEEASSVPNSLSVIDDFANYLHGELRFTRRALVWKLDDLSKYDIRRPGRAEEQTSEDRPVSWRMRCRNCGVLPGGRSNPV